MAIAKHITVSSEPDGLKPILKFHFSYEAAHMHAQMINNDLNRDVYVAEVTNKFMACRNEWRNKQKGF